jgi:hypothetical protein
VGVGGVARGRGRHVGPPPAGLPLQGEVGDVMKEKQWRDCSNAHPMLEYLKTCGWSITLLMIISH